MLSRRADTFAAGVRSLALAICWRCSRALAIKDLLVPEGAVLSRRTRPGSIRVPGGAGNGYLLLPSSSRADRITPTTVIAFLEVEATSFLRKFYPPNTCWKEQVRTRLVLDSICKTGVCSLRINMSPEKTRVSLFTRNFGKGRPVHLSFHYSSKQAQEFRCYRLAARSPGVYLHWLRARKLTKK